MPQREVHALKKPKFRQRVQFEQRRAWSSGKVLKFASSSARRNSLHRHSASPSHESARLSGGGCLITRTMDDTADLVMLTSPNRVSHRRVRSDPSEFLRSLARADTFGEDDVDVEATGEVQAVEADETDPARSRSGSSASSDAEDERADADGPRCAPRAARPAVRSRSGRCVAQPRALRPWALPPRPMLAASAPPHRRLNADPRPSASPPPPCAGR